VILEFIFSNPTSFRISLSFSSLFGNTQSKAYHKDDNFHAEQGTGYHRLDNPKVVALLNNLYAHEWTSSHI